MRMSMTAFAHNMVEIEGFTYSVEIRSVNHRFLETSIKIPENLRHLEPILRKKVQEALYRGKVDIWIAYRKENSNGKEVTLNSMAMKRWLLAFSDSGVMQSLGKPNWQTMLAMPGVMVEQQINHELLKKEILETVDQGIAMLLDMRAREGEQIKEVLLNQLKEIEIQVQKAEQYLPEIEKNIKGKLEEKATQLQIEIDPLRFEQEIALLLNKSDVREELDRILFHIKESRKTLEEPQAVGRKMDFLMQEFNREANTLSAKAYDNNLSQLAVGLKVIIEQMREQVQNLE